MSDFTRILLRQGPDLDRKKVILRAGEPAYVTDYNRIVVGDGETKGGVSVGSKFLGFVRFDEFSAEVLGANPGLQGDFIFEENTNLLHVLSGTETILGKESYQIKTNYIPINKTPNPDNINIFNNAGVLSLVPDSIDASYLAGYAIGRGLEKNPANNVILQISQPSPEISFNETGGLQITDSSIVDTKLASMPADTVKARLNNSGSPTNLRIQDLAEVIKGFLISGGIGTIGVPVGTIIDFAGNQPPQNYLPCDGREVSREEYVELFNAIGTTWGTPTTATFNLPDLNSRVTIGAGKNKKGETQTLPDTLEVGGYYGTSKYKLTRGNLPPHTHSVVFDIPSHSHQYSFTLQEFGGEFTTTNDVINGYNNYVTIIQNGPNFAPVTYPIGPIDDLTSVRLKASQSIKNSKRSLQQKVVEFVKFNFPIALSGSDISASNALSAKCFRDAGYIIDSLAADIANNANHRSRETGTLYFSGYITANKNPNSTVPALPSDQVIPTIEAIKAIGSYITGINQPSRPHKTTTGVLSGIDDGYLNPVQSSISRSFENYTTVIANSANIPKTSPDGIVIDDTYFAAASVIKENRAYLQQRAVEFVKYNYPAALSAADITGELALSAKCFRDSGFIVDSIVADILNNANHRSVETGVFYFSGALLARASNGNTSVPTLPQDQVTPTVEAIKAIGSFITGLDIPAEKDYFEPGLLYNQPFFTTAQNKIIDLLDVFTAVISNSASVPTTQPEGTTEGIPQIQEAAQLIRNYKPSIQLETVKYIKRTFPSALSGTNDTISNELSAKCFRDSGYIIDAIAADISNDANHRSIEVGEAYYTGAVLARPSNPGSPVPTLPTDQVEATETAIEAIGKIITGINISDVNPEFPFNSINGILSAGTEADDDSTKNRVVNLITTIIYPFNNNGSRIPGGYDPAGAPTPEEISLASVLLNNKSTIQDSVESYVDIRGYLDGVVGEEEQKAKCRRDVGFMVDAVYNDLTYGVKSKTVQYAVGYWDGSTSRIPNTLILNQRQNTIDTINKLKSTMIRVAVNNTGSLINSAYKKVDSLISDMVFPFNNNGNVPSYSPPGSIVPEKIEAAKFIRLNRTNIQDIITQYVIDRGYLLSNSEELSKCRRDVGFMLDSVIHDLETGVFAKSVQYAVAYWDGSTSRLRDGIFNVTLPDQRANTIDTINFLRTKTLSLLGEQSGVLGEVSNLIDVMVYPLENFGQNLPYFPRQNPSNEDLLAADTLQQNKINLQNQTIQYVDSLNIIRGRPDLQAKCYRDIGYMVDSVIDDLRNGVNSKTIQFALAYYDGSLNRIKGRDEPGLGNNNPNQVNATLQTIRYLRDRSIDLIIQGGGRTQLRTLTANTSEEAGYTFFGTTGDGEESDFGLNGDPISNLQPSAVVNKIIKIR